MALGERRRAAIDQSALEPHVGVVSEKDLWVQHLRVAIVKQAADDLRVALRTYNEGAVQALCSWFRSEWGQLLSFGQGETIIRRIMKEEEEREQNET